MDFTQGWETKKDATKVRTCSVRGCDRSPWYVILTDGQWRALCITHKLEMQGPEEEEDN